MAAQPIAALEAAITSLKSAVSEEPEERDRQQLQAALQILEAVNTKNMTEQHQAMPQRPQRSGPMVAGNRPMP